MKKHILSVDDEASVCGMLQEVLNWKGYRVSTAADSRQASKIVREDPPQLIIVDFQIEEGDGFVLIEQFRKIAPATPIMLLTGVIFDGETVRETNQKKVASYLDKTEPLCRIVREIERLLGDLKEA